MSTHVVRSPNHFVIGAYSAGLTIDFREPAELTEVEELRRSFDERRFAACTSEQALAHEAGQVLVELGVVEEVEDFFASLRVHTGEPQLGPQLAKCLLGLGVEPPRELARRITLLLERTGCLDRAKHHALRLYCHPPGGTTRLEAEATHYGYLLDGQCVAREHGRTVELRPNSFFCIAGAAVLEGPGQCVVTTRFGHSGITLFGGEVEDWGRLAYIDGCTDTLLVSPLRRGDPCLNALYFPAATRQTPHVHPSARCGVIIGGSGTCKTRRGDHPLRKGDIFFLPPETHHSFCTDERPVASRSALTVLAFHPDSDFGPTDTNHPMINRTYFKFLHRLVSSEASVEPRSS